MSKMTSRDYEVMAAQWAEKYGIVDYKVKGKYMIYNVSYPATMFEPRYTMQRQVDLTTMRTVVNKKLQRYDKKGEVNR